MTISCLVLMVLFRMVVLGRSKGCGFYLFAALIGCVYQVVISPIQWADRQAQQIATCLSDKMHLKRAIPE
jgi:hypothetical protein